MVLWMLLMDLFFIFGLIYGLYIMVLVVEEISPENDRVVKRYAGRILLTFWANYFTMIAKIILGFCWLCNRTRNNYVAYYRVSVTYCFA